MSSDRRWPEGLVAYKRTPDFTEASVPAGLLKAHSTKAGVWAELHVEQGRLRFRDLETGAEHLLAAGAHRLIFPEALHEVAPVGAVRFHVEFYRAAT